MGPKLELFIANNRNGKSYDVSSICESVEYSSTRGSEASTLSFTILKDGIIDFQNGNTVSFYAEGKGVFKGVINEKRKDQNGVIRVHAVDQLWYLKAKDVYQSPIGVSETAAEAIYKLCMRYGLNTGRLDGSYREHWLYSDDIAVQDIIIDMVNRQIRGEAKVYCLYDDFGKICLTEPTAIEIPVVLGDKSLVYAYEYTTDIKETYNEIKLMKENKEAGKMEAYIVYDSSTMANWGRLVLRERIDETTTDPKSLARTMLAYYNRERRTLKVDSLGVIGVRAGSIVPFEIMRLGDIALSQKLIIEKATHRFKNCDHTMTLETKVVREYA